MLPLLLRSREQDMSVSLGYAGFLIELPSRFSAPKNYSI